MEGGKKGRRRRMEERWSKGRKRVKEGRVIERDKQGMEGELGEEWKEGRKKEERGIEGKREIESEIDWHIKSCTNR